MTDTIVDYKGTIAICTPMYGGVAHQEYINSLLNIIETLRINGYSTILSSISNESLITRARNIIVHSALKIEDLVGVLFLDADQGVSGEDVLSMIRSEKDIIGAITPMKGINWKQIKEAVLFNQQDLALYSGIFAIELDKKEDVEISYFDPIEVKYIGTGLMYVSKKVFDDLKSVCKTYKGVLSSNPNDEETLIEYFTTSIDEETEQLLSEDYNFCKMWKSLGNKVWAAPWVVTTHVGSYTFNGRFANTIDLLARKNEIR